MPKLRLRPTVHNDARTANGGFPTILFIESAGRKYIFLAVAGRNRDQSDNALVSRALSNMQSLNSCILLFGVEVAVPTGPVPAGGGLGEPGSLGIGDETVALTHVMFHDERAARLQQTE